MKRLLLTCLSIGALVALPVFAVAESDESAIVRTITESANAATNFPLSKNHQAVLRYYSDDYFAIQDGVIGTRQMLEAQYKEMGEMLKGGAVMTTIVRASNIRPKALAGAGWATYDVFIDMHASDLALAKGDLKCTGLLRRVGSEWKIQHEHCSSTREQAGKARKE